MFHNEPMDEMQGEHWDRVYRTKAVDGVSWYLPRLELSLALLKMVGLDANSRVIDIGGGASTLVDDLLAFPVAAVDVLDLSAAALGVSRARLGAHADGVAWHVGDVATIELPAAAYSHWHDRAVLHFLDGDAARAYARQAARAIAPGGHAVIAGFSPEGPERCSGLPVVRRSPHDVAALLGDAFEMLYAQREEHATPGGARQAFAWTVLRRRDASSADPTS
jgi:SAM-dependent methyltransferase